MMKWKKTILYIVLQKYMDSDRLKRLAYHEIAHAGHYRQVGGREYWDQLVQAEVLAGGHGNENSKDAGRIALCESWAEHIGMSYAHRRYGADNSWTRTYDKWLEETWNETQHHIPVGLYHDLSDNLNDTISACNMDFSGCVLIDDQVSGFTNQQMFSCLTSDIVSPIDFINRLIANHLANTTNTEVQVMDLFNQY